jgi:hypothetical protein
MDLLFKRSSKLGISRDVPALANAGKHTNTESNYFY